MSRFVILRSSNVVLKTRSFKRHHFCRRYGFGRVPIMQVFVQDSKVATVQNMHANIDSKIYNNNMRACAHGLIHGGEVMYRRYLSFLSLRDHT